MARNFEAAVFTHPDYQYGNNSPIHVVRLRPYLGPGSEGLPPTAQLDLLEQPAISERELEQKVTEVATNYHTIGDPESTEAHQVQIGVTIANRHKLEEGAPAILVMSTSGSSLYDEKGHPNNEGNALEIAFMALRYPDRPVVYVESPGNGNSTDLTTDEYRQAAENGKFVSETRDDSERITSFEAFETIQAIARALASEGIRISHDSSNGTGVHFSNALMAALPANTMARAFSYNPSNVSDRSFIGLTAGNLLEIARQGKFASASQDPLRLTEQRKTMARRVMGAVEKSKIDQALAHTHNPVKMYLQQLVFRRGNHHGQSAAVHAAVAQLHHPDLKQTLVFPEFAAQYKRPEDILEFMRWVYRLAGMAISAESADGLMIPLGQYGHSHFPTVRQTLENYAFHR